MKNIQVRIIHLVNPTPYGCARSYGWYPLTYLANDKKGNETFYFCHFMMTWLSESSSFPSYKDSSCSRAKVISEITYLACAPQVYFPEELRMRRFGQIEHLLRMMMKKKLLRHHCNHWLSHEWKLNLLPWWDPCVLAKLHPIFYPLLGLWANNTNINKIQFQECSMDHTFDDEFVFNSWVQH